MIHIIHGNIWDPDVIQAAVLNIVLKQAIPMALVQACRYSNRGPYSREHGITFYKIIPITRLAEVTLLYICMSREL